MQLISEVNFQQKMKIDNWNKDIPISIQPETLLF